MARLPERLALMLIDPASGKPRGDWSRLRLAVAAARKAAAVAAATAAT